MYLMKKALAALCLTALVGTAAAIPTAAADEPTTVAHWRFQNDPAYVTGSVDDDNITVHDLTGNGNDLVVATVGNGDQLDIFTWDDGCDIPTAKGNTALKFDNTKKQAATVDPYTEAETSYTGGYTSGKYLETVENAPMNSMTFEEGFSFEIVYKLSSELDNNYNRYTGLFSRQGVVDTANEPPFSIALTEWSNDANGTLGVNGTGMQYVHVDPDGMKTNQEYNDGAGTMYGGEWHHILVTCEDDMTEIFIDGNDVALIGESAAIAVTDPSFSWEVGVGRKLGEGHEGDSKNVNSPEGMIRRLFAGDISEIRVTNHYMENEESLFFKSADINYSAAGGASAGTAEAEEAPAAATGAELLNKSWDTIFVDYEMMVDGSANVWLADNPVAGPIDQVEVRGWAHLSTPITAFAYAIDGGDPVKSEDFIQDRPDVKAAIHEDAEGFDISIELEGIAVGDHLIKVYAVDADGNLVDTTFDFPITIEAKPSKGLATVEDAAKGKNIITNYEFVSGSNGFGGEGPENLFDGDTATKFCTNEFPAEAIAKLDGVYKITGFTMATANDNADYNGRSPNAWTISVSPDGENWTELKKGDDSFFEELNFTYFAGEGKAENVGYVKFTADGTASGTFQVSELTLFGDKTGDAPAAEEAPAEEETPAPAEEETPAETPTTTEPTTPAADTKPAETETAKSGCGSMIGGGLIVLVTVLGSAWIAKRR
ncbi:MAG: discoidin domain-containing protein [Clostridia bacterium]|nr:discoidin domain-containing protein [Clostridia bacterium]